MYKTTAETYEASLVKIHRLQRNRERKRKRGQQQRHRHNAAMRYLIDHLTNTRTERP